MYLSSNFQFPANTATAINGCFPVFRINLKQMQPLVANQLVLLTQIKQIEDQLGQVMFNREGRALQLTEAGRVALIDADTIFETGNELTGLQRDCQRLTRQVLRIGGVAMAATAGAELRQRGTATDGGGARRIAQRQTAGVLRCAAAAENAAQTVRG